MSTLISTASPETATPVLRNDLLAFFHRAARPSDEWRVGAEFEKFAVHRATGRPLTYDESGGIRDILSSLADRFGWERHHEDGNLTTLLRPAQPSRSNPAAKSNYRRRPLGTSARSTPS